MKIHFSSTWIFLKIILFLYKKYNDGGMKRVS